MIRTTDHHMRKSMPIIVIMNINSEDKSGENNTLIGFGFEGPPEPSSHNQAPLYKACGAHGYMFNSATRPAEL